MSNQEGDQTSKGSVSAILTSVGGSPAPVFHVLRQHRPAHVWYFCSPESRDVADSIQSQLDWHPAPRFLPVARFEELGPCYRELRRRLPELLAEARVDPAEVLVDYTGGTKTMSAALVLAATELFSRFSYVGGEQREKGGLGITVDGREKVLYQDNPWSDLAVREIDQASHLWAAGQFEETARCLRGVLPRVANPLRFEAIAVLSDGLAARQRLDFPGAKGLLKNAHGRLRPMFESRPDRGPLPFVERLLSRCEACSTGNGGGEILSELLDNALRCAEQGRHEDAAARLYRAMELQGQLWMSEATRGCFVHGRCRAARIPELPQVLLSLPFCQPDRDGEIKLSQEMCFRALHALGDPRVATVVADLDRVSPEGKSTSRWRMATEKRNASILAHGLQPVGASGFDQMKSLAVEFLGFDLGNARFSIPPLDPTWFG